MPIAKGGYKPRREWLLLLEEGDKAKSKRHLASGEAWTRTKLTLVALTPGTIVSVQNKRGLHK